jgi:Undecaprenyl-phosphate galactose phosphotransferase WbaP
MLVSKPLLGAKISFLALIVLDMSMLALSSSFVVVFYYYHGAQFSLALYQRLAWTPFLFLGIAISMGLYPGYLRTPPEELKLLSCSTSLFFLVIGFLTFFSRSAGQYSRFIFIFSWVIALVTLPVMRLLVRKYCGSVFSWGYPCVLIGEPKGVSSILEDIKTTGNNTLWPMAAVVTETGATLPDATGIPTIPFSQLARIAKEHPHCHAILIYTSQSSFPLTEHIEKLSLHFKYILVFSEKISQLSLWLRGVDIGGSTFVRAYFKLLDPTRMQFKRLFDIVLCTVGSLVALPLIGLIGLAIKLDSPGPILFKQTRLGEGGRKFKILKFRTMCRDAQTCLEAILAKDPELSAEWKANHKLEYDPRITRIGHFLRATSLDELPQFFNVLAGTMSLVGPRPIVEAEIAKYGAQYELYKRLKPGITGLWQVSGRNRTTYEQRVAFDDYYARNWSVWMDIWILAKTVPEVVRGSGN